VADPHCHSAENRTGILTQSAPNLGPIFWETLKGTDGIDKQLQWQARVEGKTDSMPTQSRKWCRFDCERALADFLL